ncbi:quinolinate synthetase [Sporobacter termitidis DSM 10068]|uniref:Quinolinate synthase n=1 Tax=Sporobacter termitidis DSM 10068 TaxID=1123282 RepID=A0A1M5Z4Y9_9FIRM|nr:quinolinate synthase NadA [Sporobacter termitidis]SHI19337.1 quinolinate synthetase [Sporobacter termitidis DSM 10068]
MGNFNETQQKILKLKKEKNALILAHFYVPLEVQDIADIVGDSFEMAKRAKEAEEDLIVICGVRFMGEGAKILSPDKKVLVPAIDAGCPMADMVTVEDVLRLKAEHPDAAVMAYVNSSAAVKSVADICCTSSSAVRIAKSQDADEIIFVPDMHLAEYTAGKVPEKKFILHTGFCPTHHRITEADILAAKKAHPDAKIAVHPECRADVVKHADFIGSTAEILRFSRETDAREFIIGTEMEIAARLQREVPEKKFYSVTSAFVCPNMKKNTLQAVLNCLENEEYEIRLDEAEAAAARRSLERMVSC